MNRKDLKPGDMIKSGPYIGLILQTGIKFGDGGDLFKVRVLNRNLVTYWHIDLFTILSPEETQELKARLV
jgi:hypothetical protein